MSLLIGIVDQEITRTDKVSWTDNKIGGSPVWMIDSCSDAIQKCMGCSLDMTLVVQLYCPLSNSSYHRCLYLFVCTTKGCPRCNRWKVYRSMRFDETYAQTEEKQSVTKEFNNDMWTDDQDDWGDDDDDDGWGCVSDDDDNDDQDAGISPQNSSSQPSQCTSHSLDLKSSSSSNEKESKRLDSASGASDPYFGDQNQTAVDSDLSSSLSAIAVKGEENENGNQRNDDGDQADSLMEDLRVPEVHQRLDQLASVLNTKYSKHPSPPSHPSSRQPILLKPYYLSVVESTQQSHNASADDGHIASLIQNYEEVEGRRIKELVSSRNQHKSKGSSEMYEKSDVKHGDRMFHKFLKELQKFPGQCIRYDRCGQPLLVQGLNPVESVIPLCSKCGASRVFELQLVPGLIPWLSSQDDTQSTIEFGTILVYTCSKSCPSSSNDLELIEEHVITQYDPDHHLYR